jgi:histone H3/H4
MDDGVEDDGLDGEVKEETAPPMSAVLHDGAEAMAMDTVASSSHSEDEMNPSSSLHEDMPTSADSAVDPPAEAVLPVPMPIATNNTKRSKAEIRKPITSWMIYANENRERLSKENPGMSFTEIAKLLGEQYRLISEDERNRLNQLAAIDKERYASEMKAYEASGGHHDESKQGLGAELVLSAGRMKRIIKLDPEVKSIGKDATAALARATELFIVHMVKKSLAVATSRGVRTVRDVDFIQAVHVQDSLEFLRLDFPKKAVMDALKVSSSHASKMKAMSNNGIGKAQGSSSSSSSSAATGMPITSFFIPRAPKQSGKEVDAASSAPVAEKTAEETAMEVASENAVNVNRPLIDEIMNDEVMDH